MEHLLYCLKQFLPLRYTSGRYSLLSFQDGGTITYEATWRMWFGRVFAYHRTVERDGEKPSTT